MASRTAFTRGADLFNGALPDICGMEARGLDRRLDDRHVVAEPAIGWLSFDVRRHLYGRIVDLSKGGFCLYVVGQRAPGFVARGEPCAVVIQLAKTVWHGTAQLRNLIEDGDAVRLGLAFQQLTAGQRAALQGMVTNLPRYADIEVIDVDAVEPPLP